MQQKRVVKVWKPKIIQPLTESVSKEVDSQPKPVEDQVLVTTGGHGIHSIFNDIPFTPLFLIQDEGWIVVSRRKRDVRTPIHTVGPDVIQIGDLGGVSDGGGGVEDSIIDQI